MFSKGKANIVAFLAAASFIFFMVKRISKPMILVMSCIATLSVFVVFYNIPCTNSLSLIESPFSKIFGAKNSATSAMSSALSESSIKTEIAQAPAPEVKQKLAFNTNNYTLSGRTIIWRDAWRLFLKNPLFGYGFQADRIMLDGRNAQNSFIQASLEAGVLGVVSFTFAFILVLIFIIRLFDSPQNEFYATGSFERTFLIMVSAVLVFFAVNSMSDSVAAVFQPGWFFIAPIVAYIQSLNGDLVNKKNHSGKKSFKFFGNEINVVTVEETLENMSEWIKRDPTKLHWMVGKDMNGAVQGERQADFKYILKFVDLFTPDGIPFVWIARLKGFNIKKRVPGPDIMAGFFKTAEKEGFSNYFYGDTADTLQALKIKLLEKFPNLRIAGSYSPPFRNISEEEDKEIIEKINQARPDVLWVGLGVPKQEKWIFEHRDKLKVPVVMGVGAAFKFLSGEIKRAPRWIGDLGFEWLWRLFREPKRMWKRVFIDGPVFLWLIMKHFIQNK